MLLCSRKFLLLDINFRLERQEKEMGGRPYFSAGNILYSGDFVGRKVWEADLQKDEARPVCAGRARVGIFSTLWLTEFLLLSSKDVDQSTCRHSQRI